MMEHKLKCWPEHFRAVTEPNSRKRKLVEIRKDDRPFNVGDSLKLVEYDPNSDSHSGAWCTVLVSHCLRGGPWLPDGYVAMSIHLQSFGEDGATHG